MMMSKASRRSAQDMKAGDLEFGIIWQSVVMRIPSRRSQLELNRHQVRRA